MLCLYPHKDGTSCGKCYNCLLNKNLAWRFRLKQEILDTDFAFWLTLQYNDKHLPLDSENVAFVRKKDPQNFFRQIRKYLSVSKLPVTFKYFLTSEYCPSSGRPHYHCLLLFRFKELEFLDLTINDKLNIRLKLYDVVKSKWYHGLCYAKLFHSGVIKYLTDYVLKPSENANYKYKPFRLISKGIGEDYLLRLNPATVIENGFKVDGFNYLPRYYRDKLLPPERPGLVRISKYYDERRQVFVNSQKLYETKQPDLHTKYKSVEEFIQEQNYLRLSQKTLQEQKQKRKLNF